MLACRSCICLQICTKQSILPMSFAQQAIVTWPGQRGFADQWFLLSPGKGLLYSIAVACDLAQPSCYHKFAKGRQGVHPAMEICAWSKANMQAIEFAVCACHSSSPSVLDYMSKEMLVQPSQTPPIRSSAPHAHSCYPSASFIMAISFPDLSKAEGLKALNDHLAPCSYIDG